MSLCRPGRDGVPMTCSGAGSQLWWVRDLNGVMFLVLGACLVSPCLIPLVLQDHYGRHCKRKTAAKVMVLWKYKPLDKDDVL
jgi:hypothetical protein